MSTLKAAMFIAGGCLTVHAVLKRGDPVLWKNQYGNWKTGYLFDEPTQGENGTTCYDLMVHADGIDSEGTYFTINVKPSEILQEGDAVQCKAGDDTNGYFWYNGYTISKLGEEDTDGMMQFFITVRISDSDDTTEYPMHEHEVRKAPRRCSCLREKRSYQCDCTYGVGEDSDSEPEEEGLLGGTPLVRDAIVTEGAVTPRPGSSYVTQAPTEKEKAALLDRSIDIGRNLDLMTTPREGYGFDFKQLLRFQESSNEEDHNEPETPRTPRYGRSGLGKNQRARNNGTRAMAECLERSMFLRQMQRENNAVASEASGNSGRRRLVTMEKLMGDIREAQRRHAKLSK